MATAAPVSPNATFPADAISKLFAPPEREHPADKLRRLLHDAKAKGSYLHTAGAYDAFSAAIMTRIGFKSLYGSGWQLAATKSMYPDIGIYQSHQMIELVLEIRKGIEGARNTHWYDTEGRELLDAPPAFVDMKPAPNAIPASMACRLRFECRTTASAPTTLPNPAASAKPMRLTSTPSPVR